MAQEQGWGFQKAFQHFDARDGVGLEIGVRRLGRAGDGAGMAERQFAARVGPAELIGDHRLAGRKRAARCGGENRPVANGLDEQQDRLGLGIIDQQVDQFAHAQVAFIADADHAGEADTPRGAPRQQRAQNGAALGNERQAARLDAFHLQHRVDGKRQRGRRMNDTHGIGADQAHAGLARRGDQAFLHLAAFVARFGEAVGIDRRDRHTLGPAVPDGVLDMLGRDHDKGVVDRARNVGDGLERGHALNLVPARVDGIDVAGIAVGFEEPLRPAGVFRGVRRGADQGHGPGREQGPDQGRVVAHLALVISLLGDAARTGCRTPLRRCGS